MISTPVLDAITGDTSSDGQEKAVGLLPDRSRGALVLLNLREKGRRVKVAAAI